MALKALCFAVPHYCASDRVLSWYNLVELTSGEIYPAPQSIDDLKHFPDLLEKHRQEREK